MWIRLRFDIGPLDLITGALACAFPLRREQLEKEAQSYWSESGKAVVCLSVRSGFDLLLSSLQLPPDAEVLMSCLTVPDMQRIARHHGLTPVPIDLQRDGCTPSLEALERAVTPKSRVLLVAHLFGARIDMEPIIAFARRHNLIVIEDCAQAYDGHYRGHPLADAVLFSFGPIKTSTALGGGVMLLRSDETAVRIRQIQQSYHVQGRRSFLSRVAKYSLFKIMSTRPILALIARACRLLGINLDDFVSGAVRNFPAENLFDNLRRQPSAPLLKLLIRRWSQFDYDRLERRARIGQQLSAILPKRVLLDHDQTVGNDYWVFPILVNDPEMVVETLRSHGIDATSRLRLTIVDTPEGRPTFKPMNTAWTLSRIVFLPWYADLPERVLARMSQVLNQLLGDGVTQKAYQPSVVSSPAQQVMPPVPSIPLIGHDHSDSHWEGVLH